MAKHRKAPEEVELNLAAMLDMAFQILTFFILTFKPAPVEGQIQLRMPPPQALAAPDAKKQAGDNDKIKDPVIGLNTLRVALSATDDGMLRQIYVEGQEIVVDPKLAMFDAQLKKLLGDPATPYDQVVIQVASNLKYDELMKVLGVCTHQTIGGDPKNRLTKLSLVDEGKP
jgi:biopolymer transport protein ExbD